MATIKIFGKTVTSLYGRDAVYATAYATSDGIWNSNDSYHGQFLSGGLYTTVVGYLSFDTSVLANLGTLNSATFKSYNVPDFSTQDFTSNLRLYDFGSTVEAADWRTPAQASALTLLAHYDTSGGFSGTTAWTSDALLANLNTAGDTRAVLTSSRYESTTPPVGTTVEEIQPALRQTWIEVDFTPYPDSPVTLITPAETDIGQISSSAIPLYSDARAGFNLVTTTGFGAVRSNLGQSVQVFKGDNEYFVYQMFARFDTSVLAGGTITGATLKIYPTHDFSTTNFDIQARLHTWGTALTTADFVAGASLSGKTLLAHLTTSGLTVNAYNSMVTDALATNINQSGYTDIVFCSKNQVDNVAPVLSETISAEHGVGGYSVKLEVTGTGFPDPPAVTFVPKVVMM